MIDRSIIKRCFVITPVGIEKARQENKPLLAWKNDRIDFEVPVFASQNNFKL